MTISVAECVWVYWQNGAGSWSELAVLLLGRWLPWHGSTFINRIDRHGELDFGSINNDRLSY